MNSEHPTWHFSIEPADRIPPQIGKGQDSDPIYDPLLRKAFNECIRYYRAGERFVRGRGKQPTLQNVLKLAVPCGSIFKAEYGQRDKFGEKLLVWIEDLDLPFDSRKIGPRWFAPEYFPAVALLMSAGGSVRHNYKTPKKDSEGNLTPREKRRSHLSFGRGRNQNIRLLRIFYNADPGAQVHRLQARRSADAHREYRPLALKSLRDENARANFGTAGFSTKGRKSAFEAAALHWERARRLGRKLPNGKLSGDELQRLLEWAFGIADRLYALNR